MHLFKNLTTANKSLKNSWLIGVIGMITLVAALFPLTQSGFFPIHDDQQVGRLYQIDKAVRSGHIPPRITPDLGFGFDYPLFNFYPPFVYYVAEIFVLMGFGYITSIKLMIAVGFILAAFFMYRFTRLYFNRAGSLVASVAYTYAPYHSVDVYVRGALPEFWSFVFVPAIFWSLTKVSRTFQVRYVIYTALFLTGIILTHNLMAMMSGLVVGFYGLYLLWQTDRKITFVKFSLLSLCIGFGIPAYFWIPSLIEKEFTLINLLTQELANYNLHFIYIRQFFHSPWGYGGSIYGLLDGMSFELGKAHILLAFVSIVVAIWYGLRRKKISLIYVIFVILLMVTLFMQTFYSKPLWDVLPLFWYIQFPWRFLMFSAFTMAFVIGWLFTTITDKRVMLILTASAIVLLIGVNVSIFQPSEYLRNATDETYISPEVIKWRTSIMAFEYVPKGTATKKSEVGNTVIDISRSEIATRSYELIRGDIGVKELRDDPHVKTLQVDAKTPGTIRFTTFDIPGWQVEIDGKSITHNSENKFKLITVDVPTGQYQLTARFTDTPLRSASNIISVVSICVLIGFLLYNKRQRHKMSHNKLPQNKHNGHT